MTMRGIRGATTVETDIKEDVLLATRELLLEIIKFNPGLKPDDIGSAIFTTTQEIVSAFPAAAAREIGWDHVPMVCAREIPVPGSLPFCVRVLIHWNTDTKQDAIQHVYLRSAKTLRPDLVQQPTSNSAGENNS